MIYDPRPSSHREVDCQAIEKLRCDLLLINKPCSFSNILIPSVEKNKHDHIYSNESESVSAISDQSASVLGIELPKVSNTVKTTAEEILQKLHLDNDQRQKLEEETRDQSSSAIWFQAHQNRITGSKCGRIIQQKAKTKALLQFVIYPKPMLHLPKAIQWGKDNEDKACQAYQKYMQDKGHKGLQITKAGFMVHSMKGWLGASPDGWVVDPSFVPLNGLLEVKCPYSMAEKTPEDMCKDDHFYCRIINGSLQLDKNHQYYHQVQLQLYVASDRAKWCDFCVFTLKGVCVQRICADDVWLEQICPQLDEYFFKYILP